MHFPVYNACPTVKIIYLTLWLHNAAKNQTCSVHYTVPDIYLTLWLHNAATNQTWSAHYTVPDIFF